MQDNILNCLTYIEPVCCAILIVLLFRSRSASKYPFLAAFLSVRLVSTVVCLWVLRVAGIEIERHAAYQIYFYTYWISYAIEAIFSLLVIYSIFRLAMAPLEGLQTLGVLVFRWAAAITVALAFGIACSSHSSGAGLVSVIVTQMQQTSSILTLCLMLFVCFAIRPMGLSYASRIFGVSFGLGIMATASLVDSAWIMHSADVHSDLSLANGIATCLTLIVWSVYFAVPEKKRKMVVIPTTSPFLRWNQISEALGDEPGFVAIGGLSPEMFAPSEVEMMFRASAKMAELETAEEERLLEQERAIQSMTA